METQIGEGIRIYVQIKYANMQKNTGIPDRSIWGPRDLAGNEAHIWGTFSGAQNEFYDTGGEYICVKTRNFDVEKIGMAKMIGRQWKGNKLWQVA